MELNLKQEPQRRTPIGVLAPPDPMRFVKLLLLWVTVTLARPRVADGWPIRDDDDDGKDIGGWRGGGGYVSN